MEPHGFSFFTAVKISTTLEYIFMLDKEFQYFLEHQQELASKYSGKFIVIVGDSVVGVYDTNEDAYEESLKSYKLGEFLIQECSGDAFSYTTVFHSRVAYESV